MVCSIARKWGNVNSFFKNIEECSAGSKKIYFYFVDFCGIDRFRGGRYNQLIWRAIHISYNLRQVCQKFQKI